MHVVPASNSGRLSEIQTRAPVPSYNLRRGTTSNMVST